MPIWDGYRKGSYPRERRLNRIIADIARNLVIGKPKTSLRE